VPRFSRVEFSERHQRLSLVDIFLDKLYLIPQEKVLIVEPLVHYPKSAFEETVRIAADAGFTVVERPKVFFSRGVVLKKG
jgi:hypothetical protein